MKKDIEMKELTIDQNIKLLSDLTDRWKYRHAFVWSTFYKLIIYQFTIISLPYLVYLQTKNLQSKPLGIALLLLSLAILFLVFFSRNTIFEYIKNEDDRQKIILEKAREIYKKDFKIDIYPSESQRYQSNQGIMSTFSDFVKSMILLYAFSVPIIILIILLKTIPPA